MKMVFPTIAYKDKAIDFIHEFYDYSSEIHGSGGLDRMLKEATYEEWLLKLQRDMDIANIPNPRVPALTYFYVRETDDRIVGTVNIRLVPGGELIHTVGHIGYSVRPTERRKHYGTELLKAALEVCRTIGIKNVIIACERSNMASAGVIRNCGGVLESEFFSDSYNEILQRYMIRLD